jgi:hypothetical protein
MPDEDLLGVRFDVEDLAGELILLRRLRAIARRQNQHHHQQTSHTLHSKRSDMAGPEGPALPYRGSQLSVLETGSFDPA